MSKKPKVDNKKILKPNMAEAADFLQSLDDLKNNRIPGTCISQRVHIDPRLIETAAEFWKNIYFSITADGRLLSGIEAYDLGDDKTQLHPDKAPYIAMNNLMLLESLVIIGDSNPTIIDPVEFSTGTERERAIADFWKKNFAPTVFQCRWAWTGALAVMAGDPVATNEILINFRDQLP